MNKKDKNEQKSDTNLAPAPDAPVYARHKVFTKDALTPTTEQIERINTYNIKGRELQRILKAYGMSQKEFADRLQVSQVIVSVWCTQNKPIRYAHALVLAEIVGEDFFITTVAKIRNK